MRGSWAAILVRARPQVNARRYSRNFRHAAPAGLEAGSRSTSGMNGEKTNGEGNRAIPKTRSPSANKSQSNCRFGCG